MATTTGTESMMKEAQRIMNELASVSAQLEALKSTPSPPTPPSLSPSQTPAPPQTTSGGATTYSVPSSAIKSSVAKTSVPTSSYTGPSIVDYLKSAGQPSDFASREKLAQQYGIQNYVGSAEQNTQLLNLLRSGQQPVSPTSAGQTGGTTAQKTGGTTAQKTGGTTSTEEEVSLTDRARSYLEKYLEPIDYDSLADMANRIAEQTYAPIQDALKQVTDNLKIQYDRAKQDLINTQQQELEDLKGDYATRGLLDSGAYTEARRKLQETQAKELADLEQRESQDIANVYYSAISKKPEAVLDIVNSLASELSNRKSDAISLLSTLLRTEEDKQAEEREKQQAEEEVDRTVEIVNDKGERYIVLLNRKGQEIGRIYVGRAEEALTSATNPGGYTDQELRKLRAAGIDPTDIEKADAYLYGGGTSTGVPTVEDFKVLFQAYKDAGWPKNETEAQFRADNGIEPDVPLPTVVQQALDEVYKTGTFKPEVRRNAEPDWWQYLTPEARKKLEESSIYYGF